MGSRNWTPEQRQRQAAAIRLWRPWERSTGPITAKGKAASAQNAFAGGVTVSIRQMVKAFNQVMREQRGWLSSKANDGVPVDQFCEFNEKRLMQVV